MKDSKIRIHYTINIVQFLAAITFSLSRSIRGTSVTPASTDANRRQFSSTSLQYVCTIFLTIVSNVAAAVCQSKRKVLQLQNENTNVCSKSLLRTCYFVFNYLQHKFRFSTHINYHAKSITESVTLYLHEFLPMGTCMLRGSIFQHEGVNLQKKFTTW